MNDLPQTTWDQFRVLPTAEKIFEFMEAEKNIIILKERLDNARAKIGDISTKIVQDFEEFLQIFLDIAGVEGVNQAFVTNRARDLHDFIGNDVPRRN